MARLANRPARVTAAALAAPALALAGCKGEPAYGEVEGVVTLDSRPLPHVEVVFLPDPEKGTTGRRSIARTDAQGRYRVASDAGRDGAPVGFHRVCITDLMTGPTRAAAPATVEEGGAEPAGTTDPAAQPHKTGRPRFPSEYGSALSTPLVNIEIKPGPQTLDLEVKRELPR